MSEGEGCVCNAGFWGLGHLAASLVSCPVTPGSRLLGYLGYGGYYVSFRVLHLPVVKDIEAVCTVMVRPVYYIKFIAKVLPAANMAATLHLSLAEGVGRPGLIFQNIQTLAVKAVSTLIILGTTQIVTLRP